MSNVFTLAESSHTSLKSFDSELNSKEVSSPARSYLKIEVVKRKTQSNHQHNTDYYESSLVSGSTNLYTSKHSIYFEKSHIKNATERSNNQSICNMSKERIIEGKAILLSPESAARVYGDKGHLLERSLSSSSSSSGTVINRLPLTNHNQPGKPVRLSKVNGDLKISSLTHECSNDSASETSELSSINLEDIDETLTLLRPNPICEGETTSTVDAAINKHYSPALLHEEPILLSRARKVCISPLRDHNLKHLKTMQLSPSLTLSASQTDGVSLPVSDTSENIAKCDAPSDNINDSDSETLDQLSEFSSFSCSSMSLDQDGLMLSETINSGQIPNVLNYSHDEVVCYAKEVRNLKQALKLAEADTAILVSSKQQLQLENHDLNDVNNSLKMQLEKVMQEAAESKKDLAVLMKRIEITDEKHVYELQDLKSKVETLKNKSEKVSKDLDVAISERDKLKNNNNDRKRSLELALAKNKHFEKEINDMLNKNLKIELMLQQATEDSSGNSAYIHALRGERDDYAKKLQEQEGEMMNKQITIKQLEDRLSEQIQKCVMLASEKEKLNQGLLRRDDAINRLKSQVSATMCEKQALDGAVSRLHDDLSRVESGFTKIRKEVIQKSGIAQFEATRKSQLESQSASLKAELNLIRLESSTHSQRIRDKNNQITQLAAELKKATSLKQRAEHELEVLQSHINVEEKSWVRAVEQEAKLLRLVEEKDRILAESHKKLIETIALLDMANSTKHKLEQSNQEKRALISAKDKKLLSVENELKKVQVIMSDNDDLLANRDSFIAELEKQLHELKNAPVKYHDVQPASSDSFTESNNQILAELQESRRNLSEEISQLKRERELQVERHNAEKKRHQMKMELKESELENEKQKFESLEKEKLDDCRLLLQRLSELQEKEVGYKDEIHSLTQQVRTLQERLNEMEQDLKQSKADCGNKLKDIAACKKQNGYLREELATAKEEINSVTLKLIEKIDEKNQSRSGEESVSNNQLTLLKIENDKLREAMEQQQRYIVALQAHYQQWATEAAARIQLAQSNSSKSLVVVPSDGSTQTDHEIEPLHTLQVSSASEKEACNVSTQTFHDEKPISGSPVKTESNVEPERNVCRACGMNFTPGPHGDVQTIAGMKNSESSSHNASDLLYNDFLESDSPCNYSNPFSPPSNSNIETATQTIHSSCEIATQTEGPSATDNHAHTQIFIPQRSLQILDHDSEGDESEATYDLHIIYNKNLPRTNRKASLSDVMADGFSQTDHDSAVVGNVFSHCKPSLKYPAETKHCQTQTDDDDGGVIIQSPVDTADTSSQTSHDLEIVGMKQAFHHILPTSKNTCSLATETNFDDAYKTTDAEVNVEGDIALLNKEPNILPTSLSEGDTDHLDTSDAFSQTDHDDEPVVQKQTCQIVITQAPSETELQAHEVREKSDSFCQTSVAKFERKIHLVPTSIGFTQTDHDQELVGNQSRYDQFGSPLSLISHDSSTQTSNIQKNALNSSVQTVGDNFVPSAHLSLSCPILNDSFTQTEHDSEVVGHLSTNEHFLNPNRECGSLSTPTQCSISNPTNPSLLNSGASHDKLSCTPNHCDRSSLNLQVKSAGSESIFFESSTQTISEQNDSLPPLPNPSDVINELHTEDMTKLKAYKQTVKVLKKKLKQAEKQSLMQQEKIRSLQIELNTAKCKIVPEHLYKPDNHSASEVIVKDVEVRLTDELNQWKVLAERNEALNEALQSENNQLKKTHTVEIENMKRKGKANRMVHDRKLKETNERMKALMSANDQLRKSVNKLQIKLATSNKQLETSRREKQIYQNRSRKARASLRTLSWISSTPQPPENKPDEAQGEGEYVSSLKLPETMNEIDNSLQDLRREISVLEEQLQQHSSAVHQSSASLKRVRSQDNSFCSSDGDHKERENIPPLTSCNSPIDYVDSVSGVD